VLVILPSVFDDAVPFANQFHATNVLPPELFVVAEVPTVTPVLVNERTESKVVSASVELDCNPFNGPLTLSVK
jgi:hypothetical protein